MTERTDLWQPHELQTLRNLAQTHTQTQVAEMIGRTKAAVAKKAVELGIPFKKRGERAAYAKYSDETVLSCLRRFFAGETTVQISADTGIPKNTITNWTSGWQREHLLARAMGDD